MPAGKLNNLIEEAKQDLENGHLPLTHAMEIAKFGPAAQKELLTNAYKGDATWNEERQQWENIPLKDEPETFRDFLEWINENVLFKLSSAKFDTKATNLREDGLSCTACPNRTGANAALFDKDLLARTILVSIICFNQKKEKHVLYFMPGFLRAGHRRQDAAVLRFRSLFRPGRCFGL